MVLKTYILFVILSLYSCVISGCTPNNFHLQTYFCQSDFVFEARVIKWINKDSENSTDEERNSTLPDRLYKVDLTETYKNGSSLFRNFKGQPVIEGIGLCTYPFQHLEDNKKYLIFAHKTNYTENPVIYIYKDLIDTQADSWPLVHEFRRITHLYDCSCKIYEYFGEKIDDNLTDTSTQVKDLCEMRIHASNSPCLFTRGYCARNQKGSCAWKTLGSCDDDVIPENGSSSTTFAVYALTIFFTCLLSLFLVLY